MQVRRINAVLALLAGGLFVANCSRDEPTVPAVRVMAQSFAMTAQDTTKQYAHRDSLHRLAAKRDLDSIARDNSKAGQARTRAIARLRAREDSLVMAVVVPDTTTPPPPPPDTTPTPPPPPPPPPAFCGVTDMNPRSISPLGKPGYLQSVRDPDLGGTITRITGDAGTAIPGIGGTWPSTAAQHYSKDQPWSADGRMIFLSRGFSSVLFLDGVTYQPLFMRNPPGPEARWHPTKPDTMVYITASGGAGYWNPRTNSGSLRAAPSGYSSASMGSNEGNPSFDGRYVAILATRSDGKRVTYVIDLVAGTKGADVDLSGYSAVDWSSVSAGGRYIVAAVNDRQTAIYDRVTLSRVALWTDYLFGHMDLGIDSQGNEVAWGIVGSSTNGKRFVARRLDNGSVFVGSPLTTWNGHASARAFNRRGWGMGVNNDAGGAFDREVWMARMDGTMSVERLAHHRSNVTDYTSEPHAVPSPDGRKIMWASNWGTAGGAIQTYVVSCQ